MPLRFIPTMSEFDECLTHMLTSAVPLRLP